MTHRQPASRSHRTLSVAALACLWVVLAGAHSAQAAVLPLRGMGPSAEAVQAAAPVDAAAATATRDAQTTGHDSAASAGFTASSAWGTASVAALGAAVTFIWRKR